MNPLIYQAPGLESRGAIFLCPVDSSNPRSDSQKPQSDLWIPVFPLRTPCFPGHRVRLQIFEPRYLEMLKDIESTQEFAIALISRGEEVGAMATPFRIGTRVKFSENGPGLEMVKIQALGLERVEFTAFDRDSKPYLRACMEPYTDENSPEEMATDSVNALMADLQSLSKRLLEMARQGGQSLERLEDGLETARESGDPEAFSLYLCGCLSMPAIYQQRLLEIRSTRRRVEEALRLLEPL